MTSDRRAAIAAGVMLIAGSASALAQNAIEHPAVTGAGYLTKIAESTARVTTGGLLEFVEAATSVSIVLALYPVLRKRAEGLALTAVVFRTVEAAMYTLGAVITLSLMIVARLYAQAPASGHAGIQAIGDTLIGVRQDATLMGALAYMTGALTYYFIFYRARLIPRWLSGWGIAAEVPLLVACVLAAPGEHAVTSYTALAFPIALQEIVLALWLIVRGFSSKALVKAERVPADSVQA